MTENEELSDAGRKIAEALAKLGDALVFHATIMQNFLTRSIEFEIEEDDDDLEAGGYLEPSDDVPA